MDRICEHEATPSWVLAERDPRAKTLWDLGARFGNASYGGFVEIHETGAPTIPGERCNHIPRYTPPTGGYQK